MVEIGVTSGYKAANCFLASPLTEIAGRVEVWLVTASEKIRMIALLPQIATKASFGLPKGSMRISSLAEPWLRSSCFRVSIYSRPWAERPDAVEVRFNKLLMSTTRGLVPLVAMWALGAPLPAAAVSPGRIWAAPTCGGIGATPGLEPTYSTFAPFTLSLLEFWRESVILNS